MNNIKRDLDKLMGNSQRFSESAKEDVLKNVKDDDASEPVARKPFRRSRTVAISGLLIAAAALFLVLVLNESGAWQSAVSQGGLETETAEENLVKEGDGVVEAQVIETALAKVDFEVKLPKGFPFEVTGNYAQVHNIPNGKMIEVTYVNEASTQFLTFYVSETPWRADSGFTEVELPNGQTGKYFNNGQVQQLEWEMGGREYFLTIGAIEDEEKKMYSSEELVSIVKEGWFDYWSGEEE